MRKGRRGLISVLVMALATGVAAQQAHDHASMAHGANTFSGFPAEPGQGAFAAISEIVAALTANPFTDWSQVNIDALRDHLVDMDMLVTHAVAVAEPIPDGAVFRISLDGPGGDAAGRMVPAHAPVLAAATGWHSIVEADGQSLLVWTVSSPGKGEMIRALGFFGLMALGDHHRAHHLSMATGQAAH